MPFETVISPATKSVDASDRLKASAIELSLDVSPELTVDEVMVTVGAVLSYVQLKAVEAVFVLPAVSVKPFELTTNRTWPSDDAVTVPEYTFPDAVRFPIVPF